MAPVSPQGNTDPAQRVPKVRHSLRRRIKELLHIARPTSHAPTPPSSGSSENVARDPVHQAPCELKCKRTPRSEATQDSPGSNSELCCGDGSSATSEQLPTLLGSEPAVAGLPAGSGRRQHTKLTAVEIVEMLRAHQQSRVASSAAKPKRQPIKIVDEINTEEQGWWKDLAVDDGEDDAEAFVKEADNFQQEVWSPTALIPSPRHQLWRAVRCNDSPMEVRSPGTQKRVVSKDEPCRQSAPEPVPWELRLVGLRVMGSVVEVCPSRGTKLDLGANLPWGWIPPSSSSQPQARSQVGDRLYELEVAEVRLPTPGCQPSLVLKRLY
mmetsp:Transcript_82786/g.208426  ORF Transcript_82786/g.208426 Transcript_82786/m.208426 type:complete len:324 (+) Transcript_82786:48-1019(+)